MSKCLKIICCYFGKRRFEFNTPKNIMEYLVESINNEILIENGIDTDVVYINNDNDSLSDNKTLESYNNTKTKNGKIIVDNRQNINGSFGAYYDMALKYKNDYDYFFFCEDDVIIYKENYLREFIDFLNSDNEIGFVSLAPISNLSYIPLHSGGGCGLTSKDIFFKVNSEESINNFLNANDKRFFHNNYEKLQSLEVEFTNAFCRSGYQLKNHPKFSPLCVNYNKHQGQKIHSNSTYKELEFIYKVGF